MGATKWREAEEQLLPLKRFYNSTTPCNRLPPELLVEIILLAKESCQWILEFTHVCTHWREVALAAPIVWGTIQFENITHLRACIQRSMDAPLHLSFDFPYFPSPEGLLEPEAATIAAALSQCSDRISEIRIKGYVMHYLPHPKAPLRDDESTDFLCAQSQVRSRCYS